ncbi:MAG TPA: ribonuclease R, partial [Thermodesulfobacteriota bacterium]|nr:ribonuclease R [Thermodesulfobacteriota bacterium]
MTEKAVHPHESGGQPVGRERLLAFMRRDAYRPLLLKELARRLEIPRDQRVAFRRLVRALVAEGAIVRTRAKRYGLPERMNLVVGRVVVRPDGRGFVVPDGAPADEDARPDFVLTPRDLRQVMHGDRVVARVERALGGREREVRVIRVLERGVRRVVGRFEASRAVGHVVPQEKRIVQDIVIPLAEAGGAKPGDLVVAELTAYPSERGGPEGRVVEVLGRPEDPSAFAELIIRKHELPHRFSEAALREAEEVASRLAPREADIRASGRVDLRRQTLVTIDGETARDFDDAVGIEALPGGRLKLYVSIADVSHYVREGGALDREAYERGTSVYFPDRAIPMLPEVLSNDVCSLNPEVDRYTLTAELTFNAAGELLGARFYPSVIRSRARLTYTLVRRILVDRDRAAREAHAGLVHDLELMGRLAERLRERRRRRGSIDFDLPEPQIILDLEGGIEAIVRSERNAAHQLIEEFMIAANEAVAGYLEELGVPLLYRVHEEPAPEKVEAFREFVHNLGYSLAPRTDGTLSPRAFQRLVEEVRGRPEERLVNTVMLRTMKQARYAAENLGHFGLASRAYTHFTSPIRRYPDLVVHRILKETLAGTLTPERREQLAARLPEIGRHCSERERKAMEAEREIVAVKKCQFMASRVGEVYSGVIAGVTAFGFFVELDEIFVEGLVPVSSLTDDYYRYVERSQALVGQRTRRTFRIGDRVRVVVTRVDVDSRHIDFALVEDSAEAGEGGAGPAASAAR